LTKKVGVESTLSTHLKGESLVAASLSSKA